MAAPTPPVCSKRGCPQPPRLFGALLAVIVALLAASAAHAQTRGANQSFRPAPADTPLVTDVSNHLIAITSSYTGTDLLVFGSLDAEGDVVVVIRGPAGPLVVRRKERIAGIWLNRKAVGFTDIPAFYAVASSRPLAQIGSISLRERLQIGADNVRLRSEVGDGTADPYRQALIRNKQRAGLWPPLSPPVTFLGQKLFRATFELPANVPVGIYRTEVYLIRGDRVVAAQATPLYVDKQGTEQEIYELAHNYPIPYGLLAVVLALLAGWGAALVFRRG